MLCFVVGFVLIVVLITFGIVGCLIGLVQDNGCGLLFRGWLLTFLGRPFACSACFMLGNTSVCFDVFVLLCCFEFGLLFESGCLVLPSLLGFRV